VRDLPGVYVLFPNDIRLDSIDKVFAPRVLDASQMNGRIRKNNTSKIDRWYCDELQAFDKEGPMELEKARGSRNDLHTRIVRYNVYEKEPTRKNSFLESVRFYRAKPMTTQEIIQVNPLPDQEPYN